MTFHQSFSDFNFDPVFPGSYGERIHNFRLPQEHQHSFHSYLPNLGSVASQNVDLNYYPISGRNVPYPGSSGENGFHVQYANHAAVPNRFQSGPWANMCNGETYFTIPPEHNVSGCYDMLGNLVKHDPVYSSFPQPGREYLFGCTAGWNQQPSDVGFVSSGNCMMTNPPQVQDRQFPAYWQSFQHKEIINSGNCDSFAVPRNYSIDELVQNTVVSSTEHRCEDINRFGIQPSFDDDTNTQQPSFSHYIPNKQPYVLEPSLDVNSLDRLFDITDFHTEDICVSKSQSTSHQSVAEIPSFPSLVSNRTMPTEFVVTSSSCAIMFPMNEVQARHVNTISTAACRFVSQALPEVPQSREEPVTATESVNTSDQLCIATDVTGCDKMLSQYSSFCKQTSLGRSSAVIGGNVSEVESSLSLSNAATAGTSVTSTRMQFRNCQLQTDSSERTEVISAAHSAPVISSEFSVASKCVTSGQELVPDVIESDDADAASNSSDDVILLSPSQKASKCVTSGQELVPDVIESDDADAASNSSDDVILLSPSPSDNEQTTPVSANVKSNLVKTQCYRMQPASVTGYLNTDHQLHSVLRPVVPKPLHVRLPYVGSDAIRVSHCRSFMPSTDRNFRTCRNRDVLPSHANRIVTHSHGRPIQINSHRHMSDSAVAATQQASGDVITCTSANSVFCNSVVCSVTHDVPVRLYSSQIQHRSCVKPSSLKHSLSEPKTSNPTLKTNNCCDDVESSQCKRHQKFLRQSSQASQHHSTAWHNDQECVVTTCQNVSSIYSTSISHAPSVVRTSPKQSQFRNQKSYSVFQYSRDGSSLRLQDISLRKNVTYSVRAASILLQRIKQAKLSDIASAHVTHQRLLHRRLNSLSQNREIIDLTGDDDDDSEAYTADTCEFVFAQARRYRTRIPLLHRWRPYFCRTGSLAGASKHLSKEKTFEVDKSLPFYRCFVQKLLRNFRFTSTGVPVKVWYQEILPPAVPSMRLDNGGANSPASPSSPAQHFEENANMSETAFSETCTKELLIKRQPIVLLKRLDQSELNKYGVFAASDRNGAKKCVSHAASACDDASQNLQLEESDNNDTETVSENVVSTDHGRESIMADEMERENIKEENVTAKQTPSLRRLDELLALCRPVSVVLEHLDRIKIPQIGKELCKVEPRCQNNESITPTRSEFLVSDLSWTVTQIPRANKVPILVMRMSSLSALNASRKKVTKKPNLAHRLRSNFRCLRTRSCGAGAKSMHSLTSDSIEINTFNKSILKKIPACRKLHFSSSVWGSRNGGHLLHRHLSVPEARSPCRISPKYSVKRTENAKKTYSILAKPLCMLERVASSVEHLLPSDSSPTNNSLADSTPHDFVVNQNLPQYCQSSDSSTVEFLCHSLIDANSTSNQTMSSGTSNAFPKNLLPADSLPNDTNDLPEDCASSDSNTVVMSPSASVDDLTIAYRSPLSDVFSDDDNLAQDQQEPLDVSLEAGNSCEKFDIVARDVDHELKPTLYFDCGEVASQSYTATTSESAVQSFSNLVKSCTLSTQLLSCGTATTNALNTKQLQPTPVMLIESVNHGLEQRPAVNHLSEFVDEGQRNVRWLFPSL